MDSRDVYVIYWIFEVSRNFYYLQELLFDGRFLSFSFNMLVERQF